MKSEKEIKFDEIRQQNLIKELKKTMTNKQIEDAIVIDTFLSTDFKTREEQLDTMYRLGFHKINDTADNLRYYNILNKERKYINMDFDVSKDNKVDEKICYVFNQQNHNYETLIMTVCLKKCLWKRLFTRYKYENVNAHIFIKGKDEDLFEGIENI